MVRQALALLSLALLAGGVAAAAQHETTPDDPKLPPLHSLAVGSIPYDELGKSIAGEKIRLSERHGKVIILSFWASWCGPCLKELPVLASVAKKVGPEHLEIIAINFDDEKKRFDYVVKVLKDYPITILRDANHRTSKKFDVNAIPRMIVIDRDGKVATDHTGYGEGMIPEFVDQLNALLAAKQAT